MKTGQLAIVLAGAVGLSLSQCTARADIASPTADASAGRALFLKNCAHCHGADARGDEGPDLHKLDRSKDWIADRIRKGKPGQMTAFAGKLSSSEIETLVTYVQALK